MVHIDFSVDDIKSDGCGGLWYLAENDGMDALVLHHIDHAGDKENTGFEFPIGSTQVHGCDSSTSVFVTYEFNGRNIDICRVSKDREEGNEEGWAKDVIGDCPTDTLFASDGAKWLWGLYPSEQDGGECSLWKFSTNGIGWAHHWSHPHETTHLAGG